MILGAYEAQLRRIGLDRYMMLLILSVVAASVLPARGGLAEVLKQVTYWAVALLFFLYGAKLATATIVAGFTNWRLQLGVLLCTFVLFPLLTLGFGPFIGLWFPAAIVVGFLYIGCMPSTVQSSIAFTGLSGGNVAGAVCAASVSNLIGVVLSPVLFGALISQNADMGVNPSAVWSIAQQILLPFALGQLCRPWLSGPINRHKLVTQIVDRGSILLIVYAAFSAGVVNGIWQIVSLGDLAGLLGLCALLLGLVFALSLGLARLCGFAREDRLALLFCGSTKSLATGLPMAGILFAGQDISLIILPLMLFHLLQLMVCAVIAQRIATVRSPVEA